MHASLLLSSCWLTIVAALFFYTYETIRTQLNTTVNPTISSAIASSIGECMSCAVLVPAETLKQRAQVLTSSTSASSTLQVLRTVSPSVYYSGYGSMVLRNLPFTAIHFPIYEQLHSQAGLPHAVAAGISASFAAFVTTPLDVVKTRKMLGQSKASVVHILREIYMQEGARGLVRGSLFRMAWTGLGAAVYLGAYNYGKKWLRERREQNGHIV